MDGIGQSLLLMQADTSNRLFWVLLFMAVVFILPFFLGAGVARLLRLDDLSTRIGVVLFSIFASLAPFLFVMCQGHSWKSAIPLGIDLAGGTNLVYGIDSEAAERQQKKEHGKSIPVATTKW